MKKICSSMTARATLGALFFVISVFLVVFAFFTTGLRSATPSAGTLNPGGATVNWAGTATGGSSLDESTCVEGVNCDTFILTLSGTPADWTGLKARLTISCADPSGVSDYDLYVHKGDNGGPIVPGGESAHGGTPPEVVDLDPSNPSNGQKATWYNSAAPTSLFVDSDPIGFTDRDTGRAFAGELTLTSPSCKISFTDTDGLDALGQPTLAGWSPSSGPLGSGIDHETIGGGPYHAPIPSLPTPYPHAVYYCSQDLVTAFCLRSDDGGATFGPIVPTYTSQCGGLHGHVKVAPDGTVYLPNINGGGQGAVVVSEDNGLTWSVRPVQNATYHTVANANLQDPAVGIDNNGRVYFAMANGDGSAVVATSVDHGQTWQNIYDVGAVYVIKNTFYPAAVSADGGRASVAFYGSTTTGDGSANSFNGIWHLYVANTFDGGLTWTTTDVTPNAPMQRGCIWAHGGADICRNLLDFFDMTVDKQGRVEVGYVNGCADGTCT